MAVKIAIANQKGGVGKTTTALALSAGLQQKKKRVLMVDTDPQRNSTGVYGAKTDGVPTLYDIIMSGYKAEDCIQHTEYGDIIAGDELLKDADHDVKQDLKQFLHIANAVKSVEKDYDYVIYDTPPHVGVLLRNVLMGSDKIIVPCICDKFGVQGMMDFNETIKECKDVKPDLKVMGLLIIKYKGRQNLTRDIEDNLLPEYAQRMETKVFKTRIRESVKCQEAQALQKSIYTYAPDCTTAVDYGNFIKEVMKEV